MLDVTTFQFYPGNLQRAEGWHRLLERYGPDVVQMTLSSDTNGPSGSVLVGNTEITKGFAQEWLMHKLAERAEAERRARDKQLFWTKAATVAGFAAAIGTGASAIVGVIRLLKGV